jgi:ABC-type antimicrobial peptide transport system permease subunit
LSALGVIQLPVGMYYGAIVGEAIVLLYIVAGWSVLLFGSTMALYRE